MNQFETTKLVIRNFIYSDYSNLYDYLSDSKSLKFESLYPKTAEEINEDLNIFVNDINTYAFIDKNTDKIIGHIILKINENKCNIKVLFNSHLYDIRLAVDGVSYLINNVLNNINEFETIINIDDDRMLDLFEILNFDRIEYIESKFFLIDNDGNPLFKDHYKYVLKMDSQ